jgi:hypothetical protein
MHTRLERQTDLRGSSRNYNYSNERCKWFDWIDSLKSDEKSGLKYDKLSNYYCWCKVDLELI